MDWNSVWSTLAIIAFIVVMMRGCGGMAGGGCGMGHSRRRDPKEVPAPLGDVSEHYPR
jgi:hypothetical protein